MTANEWAAIATAPSGAMIVVAATCAPHIAASCTATGRPIFSAFRRISLSNRPVSFRLNRSAALQKQQRHAITRLITAQASAVPSPAPSTP